MIVNDQCTSCFETLINHQNKHIKGIQNNDIKFGEAAALMFAKLVGQQIIS